jgi:predicted amidohydrolase
VRLVHAAAKEHAEILVFPELSLTGYELDLADGLAFSPDDARLASSGRAGVLVLHDAHRRRPGQDGFAALSRSVHPLA